MNCKRSLELHKKTGGKLEIKSKFEIKTKEDLSMAYTPCVAEVSSAIAKNKKLAREYTIKKNTVAVVSDGSAVLGLGNIGAEASIPVMEGKAILFKELANVDAFPICLKTQDPDEIIEIVKNISPVFGGINLEDISAPNCFYVEEKLQGIGIPVMHDDQHGTAIVVVAALINAAKAVGRKISSMKIAVVGAGAAGTAIAKMISRELNPKDIAVCDSKGIISKNRKDLNLTKRKLLETTNKNDAQGSMEDALIGADVFIGVSKGGILNADMVRTMNNNPIIFAMANPIPEIMPDEAKKGGAAVIGTGRSDFPNQINNVLVFPGIFRGLLDSGASKVTDEIKINAAKALAYYVKNPTAENILPDPLDKKVAAAVAGSVLGCY
ncbi:NADP-dependent malic enzyme [Candidatus Parcubacteria bacterium]|nr:NADP-dependent malic enzyme [Candidatus Parcubacteria bacterium]